MATVYTHFSGETKKIVNGRVVTDTEINTDYDGKILHVDKRDKNIISHFAIKDQKLRKLLASPMSKENLFERLSRDYSKSTLKRHKHKKPKKKRRTLKRHTLKRH